MKSDDLVVHIKLAVSSEYLSAFLEDWERQRDCLCEMAEIVEAVLILPADLKELKLSTR